MSDFWISIVATMILSMLLGAMLFMVGMMTARGHSPHYVGEKCKGFSGQVYSNNRQDLIDICGSVKLNELK